MICRLWRGWTSKSKAQTYECIVRRNVIPAIEAQGLPGFYSIDLLRREIAGQDRVEFTTLMWFDALESIRAFTGEDVEVSHVPALARAALDDYDRRAAHFEVIERRDQRARIATGRLDVARATALLVIDVQQGFLDPGWGHRNNPDAETNVALLLEAWRSAGRPVHHVHHASRSPSGRFRRGTPGHLPKTEAAPRAGENVHVKEVNSAFIGTALESDLRAQKIDSVVLVGLTTNHCVSTTARMAANLGFTTYLAEDATAAFEGMAIDGRRRSASEVHNGALADLQGEFAQVVSTASLLAGAGSSQ